MGVIDGQAVSAAITNPAFINKNQDDVMPNKLGYTRALSGVSITDIQKAVNTLWTTTGATETTAATTYSGAPASTVTAGQTHEAAIVTLAQKFHPSTGHIHDGTTGQAPKISAANLAGVPLQGFFQQGTDLSTVTGSSSNITAQFSGKSESTGPSVLGVPTAPPNNKVLIRQASGTTNDDEYVDALGNVVYGRITFSASVWTLSYFVEIGAAETAYSFAGASDVRFFYQELFNPMVGTPTYNPMAIIPSDNLTADVIPATTALQGKVLLSSVAPAMIAVTGAAGTANATVSNADHTHEGVHSVAASGGNPILGDVVIAGVGGTAVTEVASTITLTSPALSSTAPTDIGTAAAIGTGTTTARADHVHRGARSISTDGSTFIYGDIEILGAGGSVESQLGQVVTITSPALSSSAAQSVGSSNAAGSGTTSSKADHVHQGVHSISVTSALYGDITFAAGAGVTVSQTSQTITIAAGGGGTAGELITTDATAGAGAGNQTIAVGQSWFHPDLVISTGDTVTINGNYIGVNSLTINGTMTVNGSSRVL